MSVASYVVEYCISGVLRLGSIVSSAVTVLGVELKPQVSVGTAGLSYTPSRHSTRVQSRILAILYAQGNT